MEWISVKDRLPEDEVPVFCVIEHWRVKKQHCFILARVDRDDHSWVVWDLGEHMDELSHDYNVKFWQPLPVLPIVEAKEAKNEL